MTAECENALALALRAAELVPADDWQIEPASAGLPLSADLDWLIVTTTAHDRVAGPLWRWTVEIQVRSRVLFETPDPGTHRATVQNLLAWLENAETLTAAFAAQTEIAAINGVFVDAGPPGQIEDHRWVSSIRAIIGITRV